MQISNTIDVQNVIAKINASMREIKSGVAKRNVSLLEINCLLVQRKDMKAVSRFGFARCQAQIVNVAEGKSRAGVQDHRHLAKVPRRYTQRSMNYGNKQRRQSAAGPVLHLLSTRPRKLA